MSKLQTSAPLKNNVAGPLGAPGRRTLVGLAVATLLLFVGVLMMSGPEIAYDTTTSDIVAAMDRSETSALTLAFVGMVLAAVVFFFGAAMRNALKVSGQSWFADAVLVGFAAFGLTLASWSYTGMALWKAVDYGDESAIRTLAAINDANFLPAMACLAAVYVGCGLAGITSGALPKWLAIASVAVGAVAPFGPAAFLGFMLFPLWIVAIAVCVRLQPTE